MGGTPISFLLLLDSTNHFLAPSPQFEFRTMGTSPAGSGNAHPRPQIAGPGSHIKKCITTLLRLWRVCVVLFYENHIGESMYGLGVSSASQGSTYLVGEKISIFDG